MCSGLHAPYLRRRASPPGHWVSRARRTQIAQTPSSHCASAQTTPATVLVRIAPRVPTAPTTIPATPEAPVVFASARRAVPVSCKSRIFTISRVNDDSGRRLIPYNHLPRSPDRMGFDRIVLGFTADEVSQFWIDRKIRGQPGPPRSVDSLALLLKLVPRLPGAISYARASQFAKGIRVVRVNGKLPSDPGYPLVYDE